MRTVKTTIALIVVSLFFSTSAFATNLWCSGKINRIYVDYNMRVFIQPTWHASYTMVCHLGSTWQGFSPEGCKAWFSMLTAAQLANSSVIVYYGGVSQASCSEFPTYAASPRPGYVMNKE